jgi:hypothetical protein
MRMIKFEEMEDRRKPSSYSAQTRIKVESDGSKEFRVWRQYIRFSGLKSALKLQIPLLRKR